MDRQPPSPEERPLSEMDKLQYRLHLLFVEYDLDTSVPWGLRRYVDGRQEDIFDISYFPDTGAYALGANITNSLSESGYEVIEDTLTPDGKFLSVRKAKAGDEDYSEYYNEYRAGQFNDLLIRSTYRPYGRLGQVLLRARFRFAI